MSKFRGKLKKVNNYISAFMHYVNEIVKFKGPTSIKTGVTLPPRRIYIHLARAFRNGLTPGKLKTKHSVEKHKCVSLHVFRL